MSSQKIPTVKLLLSALLLMLAMTCPLPAAAWTAEAPRRPVVLVLNSYNIGYDWSDDEFDGVRSVLGQSPLNPLVLVEYLDTKRFPDKSHLSRQADLVAAKYRGSLVPDVVLAMDNAALEFATRYRSAIFPGKSIVFCGVNDYTPSMIAGQRKITGVAEHHDSVGTLKSALRLFPKTREVLVVHDYSDTGLAMGNELARVSGEFPGVRLVRSRDIPVEDLVQQLKKLRQGQLVVLLSYATERSGSCSTLARMAHIISLSSPVPVFAVHAGELGQGVIGGIMMSGKAQGEAAAKLAEAILQGKDPDKAPVFTGYMSAPMFDYAQLKRFGIDPHSDRLPAGSILVNTPRSSYQLDKALVWFALLLIATLSLALTAAIVNGRRQLAIRALAEANNAYRHLLDSVGDPIYIMDRDGGIFETNQAAELSTGFTRADLTALNIAQLVADDCVSRVPGRLQAIASTGCAIFESAHVTRSGRVLPVEVSAKQVEFRGAPCIISLNRDISARKQSEQELLMQAAMLEEEIAERQQVGEELRVERDNVRALFDAAPVGMVLVDAALRIVDSNSTLNRLFGTDRAGVLGQHPGQVLDCSHAADSGSCGEAKGCALCPLMRAISASIRKKHGTQGLEIRHTSSRHPERGILWLRFNVEPAFFSGQWHALLAVDDVSQKREMEIQVEAEKERLAVTLASLGEGVISSDSQGRITLMNQVAADLTGWSIERALGRPLSRVFRLFRKATRQPVSLDALGEESQALEAGGHVLLFGPPGLELHITGTIAPLCDSRGRRHGRVLVFRDMTERHELENDLHQARKLESLGILAGGLAHDLNNLLTAIIGNISIAELNAQGDPQLQPFLSRALKASERTGDLTRQLLTFAKGGAPVKKITSLENIVRDSAEFALRGSNIRCEYRIAQRLHPVAADVGQMSQVVNNLVINAKQAMPQGGVLQIALENVQPRGTGVEQAGRYVRVTVQDQGVGIPEEHLERIYDPYFTTKDTGTGLGLASVHAIIAKHDGSLKVESQVGVGTTISFCLPASDATPEALDPAAGAAFRGSGRVLVMDDDLAIQETIAEMLQLLGYQVDACDDGDEALQRYREAVREGRPYGLVIMDLTIPGGMGGELATRKLLQAYPDARVVVASGYSDSSVMSDYASYGFAAAIAKPYTISVVSEVLSGL